MKQISGIPRGSYKNSSSFLSSLDRIEAQLERNAIGHHAYYSRPEPGVIALLAAMVLAVIGLLYFFIAPILGGF